MILPSDPSVTNVLPDTPNLLVTEPDEICTDRAMRVISYRKALQAGLELVVIRQVGSEKLLFGAQRRLRLSASASVTMNGSRSVRGSRPEPHIESR